jgi:hypothetical protein
MSTALANAEPGTQIALTLDNVETILSKPMRLLPVELRQPAVAFWIVFMDLPGMAVPISFSARMSLWVDTYGLTIADAKDILASMTAPEVAAKYRFATELLADLAQRVANRIERRKSEAWQRKQVAEMKKREEEAERNPYVPFRERMANSSSTQNEEAIDITAKFEQAKAKWIEYRKARGVPLDESEIENLARQLNAAGSKAAIENVEFSIKNNFLELFQVIEMKT